MNWLADRQQVLNSKKFTSLPPQNTSVSTTAAEHKKIKIKEDEKISKKRRRKRYLYQLYLYQILNTKKLIFALLTHIII